MEVRYVFGRRQKQDLPGYPSGPSAPFAFTVKVDHRPESYDSAYALLGCYRKDFIKACRGARVSSELAVLAAPETWIPTAYLNRPTIEFVDDAFLEELLLDSVKPNPWLSRAA